MAAFNQLSAHLRCSRCGREADVIVDLYFGLRDQRDYKLGDTYLWQDGKSVKNGGRPPEGNLDGEGYVVCPHCERDSFVVVSVRGDILESARPDTEKKPLIPD